MEHQAMFSVTQETKKKCLRCEKEGRDPMRPVSEFGPNKSTRDGLQRYCRPCQRAYEREFKAKRAAQNTQQQPGVDPQQEQEYYTETVYPLAQRTVNFYGDELTAVQVGEEVYTPVKYMCECLGVDPQAQQRRIDRDGVLSSVAVMTVVQTKDGKQREALCLPADAIHGWLFGIDENRVKPELREKLIVYKRECYRVLARAFSGQSDDCTVGVQRELSVMAASLDEYNKAFIARLDELKTLVESRQIVQQHAQVSPEPAPQQFTPEAGFVYVTCDRKNDRMAIGQSYRHPSDRMKDKDYNGAKSCQGIPFWDEDPLYIITDDRVRAEKMFHECVKRVRIPAVGSARGTFKFNHGFVEWFQELHNQRLSCHALHFHLEMWIMGRDFAA
jgi:hypothetical protein